MVGSFWFAHPDYSLPSANWKTFDTQPVFWAVCGMKRKERISAPFSQWSTTVLSVLWTRVIFWRWCMMQLNGTSDFLLFGCYWILVCMSDCKSSNSFFPVFQVLIADDYSDPFDAKSELNKMVKGENTGYMEPYEAQRIMTGKKRKLHFSLI